MLKVVNYTAQDEVTVIEFIRKVQADAQPEGEILKRSVLIKDDNDIVGMVSYVSLDNMGVIRYFLYDARVAGTDLSKGGDEQAKHDKHLETGLLAKPKYTSQEVTSNACEPKLDVIALMFLKLYKNAHADGIKQIAAQASNKEVGNLFQMLGFTEVNDGAMIINLES